MPQSYKHIDALCSMQYLVQPRCTESHVTILMVTKTST